MRRTPFLILLPLLLTLFGTSHKAAAGSLSVFPGCFNLGGGNAACSPSVTGGTGTYVSYHWQFTLTAPNQLPSNHSSTTTVPWLQTTCTLRGTLKVTVTVTDSQGDTGAGNQSITCSQWAD